MAFLTAFALFALGAIAGIVISACLILRGLPDAFLSAAIPDEVVDKYVASLSDTWRGFAARKAVSLSRSRVLSLVWKGSWAPIVVALGASVFTLVVFSAVACLGTLPLWLAALCFAVPLSSTSVIAFVVKRAVFGYVTRGIAKLRSSAVDRVVERLVRKAGDSE